MSIATLSKSDTLKLSKRVYVVSVVGWMRESDGKGGVSERSVFGVDLLTIQGLARACFGLPALIHPALIFARGVLIVLVFFTASDIFDPTDKDQSANTQH